MMSLMGAAERENENSPLFDFNANKELKHKDAVHIMHLYTM